MDGSEYCRVVEGIEGSERMARSDGDPTTTRDHWIGTGIDTYVYHVSVILISFILSYYVSN